MSEQASGPTGQVIFRPLAENLPKERHRRSLVGQRMTDHGDHVEWTDGKRSATWLLPDQAGNGAELPVMTTVVLGEVRSPIAPGGIAGYHVRFTDADAAVLGRIRGLLGSVDLIAAAVDLTLTDEAFAPLTRRGVTVRREPVDGVEEFYRAHPDPHRRRIRLLGLGS